MRLVGKTVLVTGASSGIGRACAVRFARDGANLVLTARRTEQLKTTAAQAGEAVVVEADLAETASLGRFCDRILAEVPRIDVLVHNAGVGIYAPSYATGPGAARDLMALNFLAPVEITRRLLPLVPDGGSVVMVSSIAGKVALPGMSVYCASKHALNAYANVLRMETRDRRIHVLSVCPGYVSTPFAANMLQGALGTVPPGKRRFGITPERCAEAIFAGVIRRKRTVVVPKLGWLFVGAMRLFPSAVEGLVARKLPASRLE